MLRQVLLRQRRCWSDAVRRLHGSGEFGDDVVHAVLEHQARVLPEHGLFLVLEKRAHNPAYEKPFQEAGALVLEPPRDEEAPAERGGADVVHVAAVADDEIFALYAEDAGGGQVRTVDLHVRGILV